MVQYDLLDKKINNTGENNETRKVNKSFDELQAR